METYKGQIFDSREEVWMAMWLSELQKNGYVEWWHKMSAPMPLFPPAYFSYTKVTNLKTKQKRETRVFTLLNDIEYTPDFHVCWSLKGLRTFVSKIENGIDPKSWFFGTLENGSQTTFIEVKPIFDQNGKTAKFSIIQKILWNVHRTFVDLIIPEKLFEGTFMPQEAMPEFKYKKKPTGKNKGIKGPGDWKTNYIPKTLNEFLNEKD